MSTPSRPDLPDRPMVHRAAEANPVQFSRTSTLRFLSDGAPGVPDICEERSTRGDGPPLHRHPWPSWELVIEGTLRVVVGDRTLRLSAGDALYVPPDVPHAYVVESETCHVVGVNLSDGRFASLQRKAVPIFAAEGGPDMARVMELARAHDVDVLGPPLEVSSES